MSRRRREQKDRKKELARQMGVKASDEVDELREKLRVTRLELKAASVTIDEAPFALRPAPLVLDLAVALIEPQGARWLAGRRAEAAGKPKAGQTLSLAHPPLSDERIRYSRPATLVLFAAPAGDQPLVERDVEALRLTLGDAVSIVDDAVRRLKGPITAEVDGVSMGVAVFPVPHRLKTSVALPFDHEKRRGHVDVELTF